MIENDDLLTRESFDDSIIKNINSLSSSVISLDLFPRNSDESSDDGRFERMLSYSKINSIKNIIIPTNEYNISKEIDIDFGDINIDFCNSKIKYIGNNTSYNYNDKNSLFKFKGSINKTFNNGIKKYIPTYINQSMTDNGYSKLVVTNEVYNYVNEGDYISLNVYTKEAPYDYHETPMILTFCKIVKKEISNLDKTLIIDYYSPYNWDNLSLVTQELSVITPLKNITVNNLNIEFKESKLQALGGICFEYCVNTNIKCCNVYYNHLPSYWISYCNHVYIESCNTHLPQYVNSGQGYNVQCLGSQDILIQNNIGYGCRHLI